MAYLLQDLTIDTTARDPFVMKLKLSSMASLHGNCTPSWTAMQQRMATSRMYTGTCMMACPRWDGDWVHEHHIATWASACAILLYATKLIKVPQV